MPNSYQSTHWTGPQIDQIYPVGSLYFSVNDIDPGTLFGGIWSRIQDKFLLCAGETYAAGTTGGSTTSGEPSNNISGSTAITIAQMPAHNHGNKTLTGDAWNLAYQASNVQVSVSGIVTRRTAKEGVGYAGSTGSNQQDGIHIDASHTHNTQGSGEGHTHTLSSHTHETMPPYLAVYVWQRIE